MRYTELQSGDVLLYEYKEGQSIYAKGITLITGSKYAHCAIILKWQQKLYVLEQQYRRMHSILELYNPEEIIYCVRPKFQVPTFIQPSWFKRTSYGFANIFDALINHGIGVFLRKWKYRPYLSKRWTNPDCATFLSQILDLKTNTSWVKYDSVVEPDDFANHTESFEFLGKVEW